MARVGMPQITITVNGKPQQLEAAYLAPAALEYWHAWLAHTARMAHNPLVEFAAKVKALPADLQGIATREFIAGMSFDVVPKLALMETLRSVPAVKTLCILVTGQDVITQGNAAAAFPLLFPFIQRQEFLASSVAEANRLRAEVGKPPIGQPGHPPAASGQPPQGG